MPCAGLGFKALKYELVRYKVQDGGWTASCNLGGPQSLCVAEEEAAGNGSSARHKDATVLYASGHSPLVSLFAPVQLHVLYKIVLYQSVCSFYAKKA